MPTLQDDRALQGPKLREVELRREWRELRAFRTAGDLKDLVAAPVERENFNCLVRRICEPQVPDRVLGVNLALTATVESRGRR